MEEEDVFEEPQLYEFIEKLIIDKQELMDEIRALKKIIETEKEKNKINVCGNQKADETK